MSTHCGYITTIKNVRKHPNADKLLLGECFGNTVCVNLDYSEGQKGVYFPSDLQLSVEFCQVHDLVRRKDENDQPAGGYLDPDKRNIKAIKLRGEKSDGLFMPISCLVYTGVNLDDLNVGDTIDIVNGHEICCKYIPRSNHRTSNSFGNKTRKKKINVSPLFQKHADTEQLAYNLSAFKPSDEIEITLKMHGTSQRTAYLPVLQGYKDSWHCALRNWLWFNFNRITHKNDLYTTIDKFKHDGDPVYDWGYVSGTRRTVLDNYEGGYYGSNEFREQHSKIFEGKLWKGETVYYEVVGFTHTGAPIMADGNNEKVGKDFVKQYGKTTTFSYGCSPDGQKESDIQLNAGTMVFNNTSSKVYDVITYEPCPQSDIYVYRMTMTNEDGDVVEYSPDFMRYRCEQMGVKTVPVMWKGNIPAFESTIEFLNGSHIHLDNYINAGEWIKAKAEKYYDGPDPIGKTHIREGVVVRIINRPKFTAFKHKNYSFKMLEGIVKESAEAPDMEEAQELIE